MLLLLQVVGYTLLSAWSHWEDENSIKTSTNLEQRGDSLIIKHAFSLSYSSDFDQEFPQPVTAIFNGKFYQSNKIEYRNDTLITFYIPVNYTRENLLNIFENIDESLALDFSKDNENPSKANMEFFKKIIKDYHSNSYSLITWYWFEYSSFEHFEKLQIYKRPDLSVQSSPPDMPFLS